jgi:thioredoxin reductase
MGIDVPLFYGQHMNAAVQEEARMVERLVASTPALEAAFDAGVDVRLGITAWGAFANGPALRALPQPVVGLTDGKRSWMCGFGALILATGARDLVLGFPGIDLPGVMGAQGLHSLLTRYEAFNGQRIVILGSGELAVSTALAALDRGLEVEALVEVLPAPQADTAALMARGVKVLTGTTILRAEPGGMGVAAAIVQRDGAQTPERLACDTICLAIGAVPTIELSSVLGCRLAYHGARGGHVPLTNADGATSLPGIYCAGDCAGLAPEAEQRALVTARAAIAWLHAEHRPEHHGASEATLPEPDTTTDYRLAWMRALMAASDGATPACLCEEVTRAEFLGIQPPRYLGCASDRQAARNAGTLLRDGPLNPDQIKRLTRAGMGPCQGRRCREQIALMLALASDQSPAAIPLASYRAPVRPLPLAVLADGAESPDMRTQWDVWFGIRAQWVPYDIIGTDEEAAFLAAGRGGNMHA